MTGFSILYYNDNIFKVTFLNWQHFYDLQIQDTIMYQITITAKHVECYRKHYSYKRQSQELEPNLI